MADKCGKEEGRKYKEDGFCRVLYLRSEAGASGNQGRHNRATQGQDSGCLSRGIRSVQQEDRPTHPAHPVTYVPRMLTEEGLFMGSVTPGSNLFKGDEIVESSGGIAPLPFTSCLDSGLSPQILANLENAGVTDFTPIQKHLIPVVLAGKDAIGCGHTGTGKTTAYLIPVIQLIQSLEFGPSSGVRAEGGLCQPKVVVLVPTRELAVQIEIEARKLCLTTGIKTVALYGGVMVRHHKNLLAGGCDLLVCTLGRLMRFLKDKDVTFDKLKSLIIDEADRFMEPDFFDDVCHLFQSHLKEGLPGERGGSQLQTILISSTFDQDLQGLARELLRPEYVFKSVGVMGGASWDVVQQILEIGKEEKTTKLVELLLADMGSAKDSRGSWVKKTLVFVETKKKADFLAVVLSSYELPSTSIHGDREQCQREEAVLEFKSGKRPFLVATSVAARGLDIVGVDHVIQYDLSKEVGDYVHRIGRTGRIGNAGRATAFFDRSVDSLMALDLCKVMLDAKQDIPAFLLAEAEGMGGASDSGDSGGNGVGPSVHNESW